MRRYGRTVLGHQIALDAAFDAAMIGSDHADYAGNCESPVILPFTGMPDETLRRLAVANGEPLRTASVRNVDIAVRCRKCGPCRHARRRHWQLRAQAEISASERTWFGTLTLAPEQQFRLVCLASVNLAAGGTLYEALPEDQQFKERCKPLVREVQLYIKRLRKDGCKFRYLVAIERHKSGAPHVHLLVHETAAPVRHKQLSAKWSLGFSKFNLVAEGEETQAARYVAKYLTKSLSRLMASAAYGTTRV